MIEVEVPSLRFFFGKGVRNKKEIRPKIVICTYQQLKKVVHSKLSGNMKVVPIFCSYS